MPIDMGSSERVNSTSRRCAMLNTSRRYPRANTRAFVTPPHEARQFFWPFFRAQMLITSKEAEKKRPERRNLGRKKS